MQKYISYEWRALLGAVSLSFVLGGCGGSDGKHHADALHVGSANSTAVSLPAVKGYGIDPSERSFDPDAVAYDYDNGEGMKMAATHEGLYIDYQASQPVENIQFFIDADNDENTGNLAAGGADYLIENGYIFASTDPQEWSWAEIGKLESAMPDDRRFSVLIGRGMLPDLKEQVGVSVRVLDKAWQPVAMSPTHAPKSIYRFEKEKGNSGQTSAYISQYISEGEKSVYLSVQNRQIDLRIVEPKLPAHIQLCIDADNDAGTGYHTSEWKDFGYDYMIEDGILYRYSGAGDWQWDKIAVVSTMQKREKGAEILELSVPMDSLPVASQFRIGVMTHGSDWSDTDYLPDENVPTFSLSSVLQLKIGS